MMHQSNIPVMILAAGQSSRMQGRDKLLELVDGVPLLRRLSMMCRAATQGPVIVAMPPMPHSRYAIVQDLDVSLVPVQDAAEGISASLRAAFSSLPTDALAAMLVLADLPDLSENDLRIVLNAVDLTTSAEIWRGATASGKPGHPIVFKASLFARMSQLHGDAGGAEVIKQFGGQTVLVSLEGDRALRDLDTPEDWERWRRERGDSSIQ